jgi:hypothetical protein
MGRKSVDERKKNTVNSIVRAYAFSLTYKSKCNVDFSNGMHPLSMPSILTSLQTAGAAT